MGALTFQSLRLPFRVELRTSQITEGVLQSEGKEVYSPHSSPCSTRY